MQRGSRISAQPAFSAASVSTAGCRGWTGWLGRRDSNHRISSLSPLVRLDGPMAATVRPPSAAVKAEPTAKTRHQKWSAETGGRNGASIAKFRTRRPAHICQTSPYRPVFERPSYVTRWRRTGWLGRRDSNLRIPESKFAKTQPGATGFEPLHLDICRNHLASTGCRRRSGA
jgi:hypothetical protein